MPLSKEEKFKIADDEYRRFEAVRLVSVILILIAYIVLAFDVTSQAFSSLSVSIFYPLAVIGIAIAIVGLSCFFYSTIRMKGAFSTLEEETRHFLLRATEALASYASKKRKRDRTRAVTRLRSAASVIDRWNGGNLAYLKPHKDIVDTFSTEFRDKFVSAVAESTPEQAEGYHSWLVVTQNNILNMSESSLGTWTEWFQKLTIQAGTPSRRFFMPLALNAGFVTAVFVIGYAVFFWIRSMPGTTFDSGLLAAGLIWGPIFTGYIPFVVQKYFSKIGKRESPDKKNQN